MQSFEFLKPRSLEEVFHLWDAGHADPKLFAGGTAVVQFLKRGLIQPDAIISLSEVPGLADIVQTADGSWHIGAMVTHRRLEFSESVAESLPALHRAESGVGNPRIRNMGTIGGNLCHADPSEDPPVVLLALDATLHAAGKDGKRSIPAANFFLDYYDTALRPGEVLTEIEIPSTPRHAAFFLKFSPRVDDDFGTVTAAAALEIEPGTGRCLSARIAVGCVAEVPFRCLAAESLLAGQAITREVAEAAGDLVAKEARPLADVRGSERYKRAMSRVIVSRAILSAADRQGVMA